MNNFPHKVISTYKVLMKKAFNEDIDETWGPLGETEDIYLAINMIFSKTDIENILNINRKAPHFCEAFRDSAGICT